MTSTPLTRISKDENARVRHPTQDTSDRERSNAVGVGMVIAAAICTRYFGNDVIAEEILGAAGLTDMDAMRKVGAEAYDVQALKGVLRHFKGKAALQQRPAAGEEVGRG